jgi:uncharacterized paraquat-inducible protein A
VWFCPGKPSIPPLPSNSISGQERKLIIMPDHELHDEDWADDDDEVALCPECGGPIHGLTDKCPRCGYWLTETDQRSLRPGLSKPLWLRITAAILLLAFLFTLLAIGNFLF